MTKKISSTELLVFKKFSFLFYSKSLLVQKTSFLCLEKCPIVINDRLGSLRNFHFYFRIMNINYFFNFVENGEIFSIFFLSNTSESGQAHSANHALRRTWAKNLPRNQHWAPLENSDYLCFLHENDLHYEFYCVFKYENAITIFVK